MDVMLLLENESLKQVYADFKRTADATSHGLTLREFVSSVLRHVAVDKYRNDPLALVRHLIEIFRVIDVNGDRAMEWTEFTSFCIEAGMAAVHRVPKPSFTFHWDGKFADDISHASGFSTVSFAVELNVVIAIEVGSKVLRMYSPQMVLLCSLDCGLSLTREQREVDASAARGYAYVPRDRLLAVLLTNHVVVLWHLTDRNAWKLEGTLPPPPPGCLCTSIVYEPYSRLLLLGCSNGTILTYSPTTRKLMHSLDEHRDVVLAIVPVPSQQGMVTSGLDGQVLLWDTNRGKVRRALRGHGSHVLRMLSVDPLNLIMGINGKGELLAIDLSVGEVSARVTFHGLSKLVDFAEVPSNPPRVVSLDSDANMKVWEVTEASIGVISCVHIVHCPELIGYSPRHCALIAPQRFLRRPDAPVLLDSNGEPPPPHRCLASASGEEHVPFGPFGDVIIGTNRLHRLCSVGIDTAVPPSVALYNPVTSAFVTSSGQDVSLWDADTGKHMDTFVDAGPADISCACFDDRQRKLFLGMTRGLVHGLNLQNGSFMKAGVGHTATVTALVYAVADRCLVSASWDGSLAVWDEGPQEALEPLRFVSRAHDVDITALAYSFEISLIVTGDRNGTVKVWDFQDLKLLAYLTEHKAVVTAAATMRHVPLFATADSDGVVIIWTARGSAHPFNAIYTFRNTAVIKELVDLGGRRGSAAAVAASASGSSSSTAAVSTGGSSSVSAEGRDRSSSSGGGGSAMGPSSDKVKGSSSGSSTFITAPAAGSDDETEATVHTRASASSNTTDAPARSDASHPSSSSGPVIPRLLIHPSRKRRVHRGGPRSSTASPMMPSSEFDVAEAEQQLLHKEALSAFVEQVLEERALQKAVTEGNHVKLLASLAARRRARAAQSSQDVAAEAARARSKIEAMKSRLVVTEKTVDVACSILQVLVPDFEDAIAQLVSSVNDDIGATASATPEASITGGGSASGSGSPGSAAPSRTPNVPFSGSVLLALGDDAGRVRILDISQLVKRSGVKPLPPSRRPAAHQSYNSRRRTHRIDPGPVVTDESWFYSDDKNGTEADVNTELLLDMQDSMEAAREAAERAVTNGSSSNSGATAGARRASVGCARPLDGAAAAADLRYGMTIPIGGGVGVGIESTARRRSKVASRVMRRASIVARVPDAFNNAAMDLLRNRVDPRDFCDNRPLVTQSQLAGTGMGDSTDLQVRSMARARRKRLLPVSPITPEDGDVVEVRTWSAHSGAVTSLSLFPAPHIRCARPPTTERAADVGATTVSPSTAVDLEASSCGTGSDGASSSSSTSTTTTCSSNSSGGISSGTSIRTGVALASLYGYFATSCGVDSRVLVWDVVAGTLAGQLGRTAVDEDAILDGIAAPVPWQFPPCREAHEANKTDVAVRLLDDVRDSISSGAAAAASSGAATGGKSNRRSSRSNSVSGAPEPSSPPPSSLLVPEQQVDETSVGYGGSSGGDNDEACGVNLSHANDDGCDTPHSTNGSAPPTPSPSSYQRVRSESLVESVESGFPRTYGGGAEDRDDAFMVALRAAEEMRRVERTRLLHDLRLLEAVPKHVALAALKDIAQDVERLHRARMDIDELGAAVADILGTTLGGEEGAVLLAAHAEGEAAVSAYGEGMMSPEEVARLDDAVAVSASQLYDDSDVINQHDDLVAPLPPPNQIAQSVGMAVGGPPVNLLRRAAASRVGGVAAATSVGADGKSTTSASAFEFMLSARSPATVAASALGPAAVAVLGLSGYDTGGLAAGQAVRTVKEALRTLRDAYGARTRTSRAMTKGSRASASDSRASRTGNSSTTTLHRTSRAAGDSGGGNAAGTRSYYSRTSVDDGRLSAALPSDTMSTATEAAQALDYMESATRRGGEARGSRGGQGIRILDSKTAIALVEATGGIKPIVAQHSAKIGGGYPSLVSENARELQARGAGGKVVRRARAPLPPVANARARAVAESQSRRRSRRASEVVRNLQAATSAAAAAFAGTQSFPGESRHSRTLSMGDSRAVNQETSPPHDENSERGGSGDVGFSSGGSINAVPQQRHSSLSTSFAPEVQMHVISAPSSPSSAASHSSVQDTYEGAQHSSGDEGSSSGAPYHTRRSSSCRISGLDEPMAASSTAQYSSRNTTTALISSSSSSNATASRPSALPAPTTTATTATKLLPPLHKPPRHRLPVIEASNRPLDYSSSCISSSSSSMRTAGRADAAAASTSAIDWIISGESASPDSTAVPQTPDERDRNSDTPVDWQELRKELDTPRLSSRRSISSGSSSRSSRTTGTPAIRGYSSRTGTPDASSFASAADGNSGRPLPPRFGPYRSSEVKLVRELFHASSSAQGGPETSEVSLEVLRKQEWGELYSRERATEILQRLAVLSGQSGAVTVPQLFSAAFPLVDSSTMCTMIAMTTPTSEALSARSSALKKAAQEQEFRRAITTLTDDMRAEISAIFNELDENGDGVVTMEEVFHITSSMRVAAAVGDGSAAAPSPVPFRMPPLAGAARGQTTVNRGRAGRSAMKEPSQARGNSSTSQSGALASSSQSRESWVMNALTAVLTRFDREETQVMNKAEFTAMIGEILLEMPGSRAGALAF